MHNKRRNNMGGGQHRHHSNRPRRFNNNRPQGGNDDPANVARTRRNATQNREKYQMMARDALGSGDRVLAEYYLQHSDHYHRVILALPPEEAPRPQYMRGYGPQAEGEQHNGPHSHDSAQPAHPTSASQNEQTETTPAMPAASHALPSFITQQPINPEEPRE